MTARIVVRTEKSINNKTSEKTKEGIMSFKPSLAIKASFKLFSLSGPLWGQNFLKRSGTCSVVIVHISYLLSLLY